VLRIARIGEEIFQIPPLAKTCAANIFRWCRWEAERSVQRPVSEDPHLIDVVFRVKRNSIKNKFELEIP
jgi:hypothetical protein